MNNRKKILNTLMFALLCVLLLFGIRGGGGQPFAEHVLQSLFPNFALRNNDTADSGENADMDANYPPEVQNPDVVDNNEYRAPGFLVTYDNISVINNFDIIKKNLYNIDSTAYVYDYELDFDKLLSYNLGVDFREDEPKVLIFHTHSREAFCDSEEGNANDTIVGVGDMLANILRENYGISVIHHKGVYDYLDGKEVRNGSYEIMEPDIRKVLAENPSIEVIIDLHRDSVPEGRRLITNINGTNTATIMFFNGICRLNENGEPKETNGLVNENLEENLATSLRMKLLANEMFPGFTRKNYIKPYRYSLHMAGKSMLIEVGADSNTVAEAKAAMIPLAEILVKGFSKETPIN